MHMLVEKPISMRPAEEVERLAQVHAQLMNPNESLTCVYLSGIRKMGHHLVQRCRLLKGFAAPLPAAAAEIRGCAKCAQFAVSKSTVSDYKYLVMLHPQVLHELADEKKLVIAVGYMLRYNPAIEKAKELLNEVCFWCPSSNSMTFSVQCCSRRHCVSSHITSFTLAMATRQHSLDVTMWAYRQNTHQVYGFMLWALHLSIDVFLALIPFHVSRTALLALLFSKGQTVICLQCPSFVSIAAGPARDIHRGALQLHLQQHLQVAVVAHAAERWLHRGAGHALCGRHALPVGLGAAEGLHSRCCSRP